MVPYALLTRKWSIFSRKSRVKSRHWPKKFLSRLNEPGFARPDITGDNTNTPITTFVERASQDNRRVYREELVIEPPSPVKQYRAGQIHPTPSIRHEDGQTQPSDASGKQYQMGFFLDDTPMDPMPEPRQVKPSASVPLPARPGLLYGPGALHKPIAPNRGPGAACATWTPPWRALHGAFPLHSKFVVLHINGIHEVAVDACDCEQRAWAGPPEEQLQRASWFPATDSWPRTCATMEMLDHFLLQTYQAKTTMYEYYSVLEKCTNNAGIKPPNRYHAFLRMHAWRGHAKSGVMGTKQGELVVRCSCCPIPGVNLPDGWEITHPEEQFLYVFFLAIDTCFRLKRWLVLSVLKDPSLGSGWSYMVESVLYRQYLLTVTDQKEMSTCSGLAGLDHANTKFSRGYAVTGVGMGVCAWHEFVQPNGIGDLQKGEQPRAFVIPKLHIKGHKLPCQDQYSLELIPGSAQTDGEGSREDTLNGHWGSWNWQKLVGLGERLRTKRDRAAKEYMAQLESFTLFTVEQGERVAGWQRMVEEYEADGTKKNPYWMTTRGLTEADVLLEFERKESQHAAAGVPGIHAVSPSSFVAAGMNVKDEQQRVRVQVELKKSGTSAQQIDIVALRCSLNRSLHHLRDLQATYTPVAILALGQRENVPADEQPENIPLFLPSGLTPTQHVGETVAGLAAIESSLRDVQLSSSLELLRHKLQVKSRLVTYKSLQARAQGANTRSKGIVDRNECKIWLHSEKYQMAWEAKRSLVGGDAEAVGWKKLLKEDIRCMQDAEELAKSEQKRRAQEERCHQWEDALRREGELPPLTVEEEQECVVRGSESVCHVSWIRTGAGMMGSDVDLEEALRIEWCKAYARKRRWHEEMLLVEEEVRRAEVTLEFWVREWEARALAVPVGESQMQEWDGASDGLAKWTYERSEGAVAYALKQAAVFRDVATRLKILIMERRMLYNDEWVDGEGGVGRSEVLEEELEDARGDDVADDDFILGGGVEEDDRHCEGDVLEGGVGRRQGRRGGQHSDKQAFRAPQTQGVAERGCSISLPDPSCGPTPAVEEGGGRGGEAWRVAPRRTMPRYPADAGHQTAEQGGSGGGRLGRWHPDERRRLTLQTQRTVSSQGRIYLRPLPARPRSLGDG
ncbi:hypothetical protein B0H14DRAFT_2626209 [Mycena olivaceomarginata]|nr:hypothetical protein B0H14DRAFT_2626209 [Mycena olivaceomarginata]